jgi:hypothetical protein
MDEVRPWLVGVPLSALGDIQHHAPEGRAWRMIRATSYLSF